MNQDSLACSFNKHNDFLAIVCDGVGSVAQSEKASKIIADKFSNTFNATENIASPTLWFKDTLKAAMDDLIKYAQENQCPEISTTIAVLIVIGKKFYTYNIGDTRIYAIRKHKATHEVKKYSYDHNYKNYLLSHNAPEEKIMACKAKWHALTNFIDASNPAAARFEANSGTIDQKTYFLICTDGLYGYVHDNTKYNTIVHSVGPLSWRLGLLNHRALANGSDDNISGILIRVK